ncbi:assimilatory nitrite reductase (NAD(P)H) large subunit precursor [Mucilaginibacter yixingensis]|uniref:Assimilatory nitrite reductase (NAD(P)H) large subunit n=1 Tax=Mucilaginibacter yixingensis TaxID=1295612 RepID=A0A2T5JC13_9SPHI|nr:nitrite reductase large subunit NirB [Mucilaginibacter yixingensis]PTQ99205.1 assimilatory nitrite reductase (NAD(P)H) large subunit precursor [Mucilaginibacter yixingensis]
MSKPTIVVVGNGMVGYKFCEKLIARSSAFQIIVFGEEPRRAYDRVHLSEYFAGKTAEDLSMSPADWYAENNINLYLDDPVQEIDRHNKTIHSLKGVTIKYDYLVLATGSSAFVPDVPGINKDGVFVYRTIEDLDLIKAYAANAKSGAVMGGGLLGLEAAKALIDLGIQETHVIEFAPRLMPRQIDTAGSAMLQAKLEQLGLRIHLNKSTASIDGDHKVESLRFNDDSALPTDMLVISAGIRPRDELARLAGLHVGTRGGILVNDFMQTSDETIFAIGECALHEGMIYGLVAPGYEMADVVVNQIAGGEKSFKGFDMSTKLKLIGVDVASFGDAFISEPACRTIVFEDTHKGIYKRINISTDGKLLLGGILIGDADAYNMLLQTVNNKLALPPNPEDMILGSRGGEQSEGAGVMSLPEDALICSCEAVTKGGICDAVNDGACSLDDVKKCTKAGTGCGGCVPMVKDLIAGTLKANGQYVKNVICEHFDYSRQELYDLIKINNIKNYDLALDHFGRGDGCETCKPLVASIMSSLWNDVIVKQDTIQDSNDRFLANIQKGGTYSVVPRIPGGEITPEKLIVIGQVAQKYGLYTKITGGQRIDLFGAHMNDLPEIWEELINAGFESGHAYGKALRTVKSCVGSTWCRFGLHDSVSFAIEIEERYKGIRAPHKLKGGVSGCIRECAEAQGKDFGIIATEKGWNLYICGNGGSKPQHAQLLAADIDDKTLIKYLDRFLMFYIKTADPLTRTATWLNKMEGGMSYLKNVILNDSLGINAQLEEEMQLLVDTFHCEWKEVVNNPELRKRFQHFVNAPAEKDPNVKFEGMRDQIKATW